MDDTTSFDNTTNMDAYLRNEMTAEQAKAFEVRLQSEPGLREELEFHRSVMEALVLHTEDQVLKHRVGGIRQAMLLRKPGGWHWRKILVVAVLLLPFVIVGGWYWSRGKEESTPEQIPGTPLPDSRPGTDSTSSAPPAPSQKTKPIIANNARPAQGTESVDGSSVPQQFSRQISVRYLKVVNSQVENNNKERTITLTVFQSNEAVLMSYWADPVLQLFVPRYQFDPAAEYRLIELDNAGKLAVYLGIGQDFYSLAEGNDTPKKETQSALVTWLKH